MPKSPILRPNQSVLKGKPVKLAVLGPKNSINTNTMSSSDPNRDGDTNFLQSIRIQNGQPKQEGKADIMHSNSKFKAANQSPEPEFYLFPVLTDSYLKEKAKAADNLPNKVVPQVPGDRTDQQIRIRAKNGTRILGRSNDYKKNSLLQVENNSISDKPKVFKFLTPIENERAMNESGLKGRRLERDHSSISPERNQDHSESPETYIQILEGSKKSARKGEQHEDYSYHNHNISETINHINNPSIEEGSFRYNFGVHTPPLHYEHSKYDDLGDERHSIIPYDLEGPFIDVVMKPSYAPLRRPKDDRQFLLNMCSNLDPYGVDRTSQVKDFRIQNVSPKKNRVKAPTSSQSISYSNQCLPVLSTYNERLNATPELRMGYGVPLNNNPIPTKHDSSTNSLNLKSKKTLSPPKLKRDDKINAIVNRTKIAEIQQKVLSVEWSNSQLPKKPRLNAGSAAEPPVKPDDNSTTEDMLSVDMDASIDEEEDMDESEQTSRSVNKKVLLLESIYSGRPPTVYFPYPSCCEQTRSTARTYLISQDDEKVYDLKYKAPRVMCLKRTFETAGFKKTEGSSWNVLWAQPKYDRVKDMNKFQKTNHFPGCWEVGRKDGLWRNLSKMKRQFAADYNFLPNTYLLSSDYERFMQAREAADNKAIWIMKPCASACGRGIKLITKATKLKKNPNYLVSEYVANPHLIDGHKYDLRIYVLVSSYDPLRIYLFKEGLVRFATAKYRTTKKHLKQRFAHLTNWSVNKNSENFVKNEDAENDGEVSKWSFSALRRRFAEMGIDYDGIFEKIKDIIIKTLIAVDPLMLTTFNRTQDHKNNCFELYGFDILLDSHLKPWLMEVNVCASLNSSSPLDKKIKTSLMCDIMNLIGIQPFNKKKVDEELKKKEKAPPENRKLFTKNFFDLSDLNEANCVEKLSPEDWNVLFETDEELYRRGNFERLFPLKDNTSVYSKYFEYQRYNNILVWQWLKSKTNFLEKISNKGSDVAV